MAVNVQQLMTKKLITIQMGSSVAEAEEIMKLRRIRHLPVVDLLGNILGIVSDRDIANLGTSQRGIEEYMTRPVYYIDQDTPLRKAAFTMLEKKISCLFVANKAEEAVGIITTDDLLWYLTHLLDKEDAVTNFSQHLPSLQALGEVARELGDMGI